MEKRQAIIIGSGIAGAATAWALTEAGVRDILILDAAEQPGTHSTGRNAAILRTAIPDPNLHALARESAQFYRNPPTGFSTLPLVDEVGVLLTAPIGNDADALAHWISDPACAFEGNEIAWATVRNYHSYIQDFAARAWFFPREGVLDVHAILHAFLQQAQNLGAEIRLRSRVQELILDGQQVIGVRTATDAFYADAVLLAEGAWAGSLLPNSITQPKFQAHRRHLVVSGQDAAIDPRAPVLWNIGADEFYFRPESGGMLMSACDHVPVQPEHGELVERDVLGLVAEKALRWLPGLENATAAHVWAGMRTFAPTSGFHIGPDPQLDGLFWAAGLAGHGITCAPAVGRLAARLLLEARQGVGRSIEV